MRIVRWTIALLLPAFLAVGVSAAQDRKYMVEMELWTDGEQRATPMLVVEPNKLASFEIGGADGQGGWKIELRVEPTAESEGAPVGSIWLDLTVYERQDGKLEQIANSLLGMPEGQAGTMSVVDAGIEQATQENSRVYLTATASALHSANGED